MKIDGNDLVENKKEREDRRKRERKIKGRTRCSPGHPRDQTEIQTFLAAERDVVENGQDLGSGLPTRHNPTHQFGLSSGETTRGQRRSALTKERVTRFVKARVVGCMAHHTQYVAVLPATPALLMYDLPECLVSQLPQEPSLAQRLDRSPQEVGLPVRRKG